MKPTVGRIVHYHTLRMEGPFAALVIRTQGDAAVELRAFLPDGVTLHLPRIPFATPGHWSWPPRE